MKCRTKGFFRIMGVLLTFLLLFTVCPQTMRAAADGQTSLWVVAERMPANSETDALQDIADLFRQKYPQVTLRIDYLPAEDDTRAEYLDTIREAIQNGKGPDVYLLPTRDVLVLGEPKSYTYQRVEMLFPDVELAMHGGVFYDLSQLYDSDLKLDKENLQPDIMDAGTVDDARYVLPLEYRQPVIYAFPELLKQYGLDTSDLDQPFIQWAATALATQEQSLACCADHIDFSLFSELIDYEDMEVSLEVEELAEYLSLYQKIHAAAGKDTGHQSIVTFPAYIAGDWTQYPANLYSISCAPAFAAIASIENSRLEMLPLYTDEYETCATVAYYGAIGANCTAPELAYQLLRLFLTEEGQQALFHSTAYEQVWPTRWKQAVAWSWDASLESARAFSPKKVRIPGNLTITAENLPILEQEIDDVRFPLASPNILGQYAPDIEKCSGEADFQRLSRRIITSLSDSLSERNPEK